MISLAEARDRVVGACPALPPIEAPLADALGLVLAQTVVAGEAVPPFASSAMDGFAVRAADTAAAPVELRIVGTLAAGAAVGVEVDTGQAVRIMTGAPLPPGADAVVMVERTSTSADGAAVTVEVPARPGDHFRPAGEDLREGDIVFAAGTRLGPGHIGVLANLGLTTALVHCLPVVGVLSTGDELVADGSPLGPAQIRDSNRPALLASLAQSGFATIDLGVARDDEASIEAAIENGLARCDAVITSGGVSMGDFDYVKAVLQRRGGGAMSWMQVAIRPAKPLAFGLIDGIPVFGLPGNPVSSLVSFELFARPALRRMMGLPDDRLDRPRIVAVADEAFARKPDGKVHFVRAAAAWHTDGRLHVRSAGAQSSNLLVAMARADALAVVPDGDGIEAGADVEILRLVED
ncbi:MAG: molybdopterin molybdotransferase [Actinomycetota bacterium]|nr:molybdopterin molybdotransferase [Actinomycetota bacterium]